MSFSLGSTGTYQFEFRKMVNGISTLYDPNTVKVSLVKGNGAEDTLTFGGVAARDDDLVRISEGVFEVNYVHDVLGRWKILPYCSDTVGAKTWPSIPRTGPSFTVEPVTPHTFGDVSAP